MRFSCPISTTTWIPKSSVPLYGQIRPPLLIAAVTLLVYLNSLSGVFQFDDHNVIVNNPAVHGWSQWWQGMCGIRPLLKLSYTLNWTCGLGLIGFHLFNVLVHVVNGLFVYRLAQAVTKQSFRPELAGKAALTGALLFAIHPVQTEAITYLSGRSSSLFTCFYLASLFCYLRCRRHAWLSWPQCVSAIFFVLALLTKEVALTLPLALLLWEICFGELHQGVRGMWRRQWLHWLILFVAAVALLYHPVYRCLIVLKPTLTTVLTQIDGVSYLLTRLFAVTSLNIDPDLRLQPVLTRPLASEACALALLLGTGVWMLRRKPLFAFAILWLFLQLLPTNTLAVRWDIANERQLYLAGVGLFIAAGFGLERVLGFLPGKGRKLLLFFFYTLLGLCTVFRNDDYQSQVTLWEATVKQSPAKARVYNNLGYAYLLAGERTKARRSYLTAVQLRPDYLLARNNLQALDELIGREEDEQGAHPEGVE